MHQAGRSAAVCRRTSSGRLLPVTVRTVVECPKLAGQMKVKQDERTLNAHDTGEDKVSWRAWLHVGKGWCRAPGAWPAVGLAGELVRG